MATITAKRILVIDDEDDIREVSSAWKPANWEVLTACSGSEAMACWQPDAILLDVMMPEMDGLATFQKLQANSVTAHIPVILLTAKVQSADRQRFAELGLTAMIAKPFNP